MKAVILAGGLGTRLSEETDRIPKPMVEVGGRPVLWHIMKYYSSFGIDDFVICCGYRGYVIKEYFANYFVVLPTRNRCTETLSTIATVLASTHEDLILHVFDNNSTDGTRDAVLALEEEPAMKAYGIHLSSTPPTRGIVRSSCRRSILVEVRSSGPLQESVGQQ